MKTNINDLTLLLRHFYFNKSIYFINIKLLISSVIFEISHNKTPTENFNYKVYSSTLLRFEPEDDGRSTSQGGTKVPIDTTDLFFSANFSISAFNLSRIA